MCRGAAQGEPGAAGAFGRASAARESAATSSDRPRFAISLMFESGLDGVERGRSKAFWKATDRMSLLNYRSSESDLKRLSCEERTKCKSRLAVGDRSAARHGRVSRREQTAALRDPGRVQATPRPRVRLDGQRAREDTGGFLSGRPSGAASTSRGAHHAQRPTTVAICNSVGVGVWLRWCRARSIESVLESHGPYGPFELSIVQIGLETTEVQRKNANRYCRWG